MEITLLKSKIHRATITDANLFYEGSLSVDPDLLDRAGLMEYEKVQIVNINNGARLETYIILAERGSGDIELNGAAARLGHPGDHIIIIAYCNVTPEEAKNHKPRIILVDENNKVKAEL